MKIERAQTSKIHGIDFNNLSFGQTFTDHMFVCDYIDGAWVDPRIIPTNPFKWILLPVFFITAKLFLKE